MSVLHRAARVGDCDAIRDYIERYPEDINRPGTFGGLLSTSFPIHIAAYNNQLQALRLLLEAGAQPDCQNYAGDTPLHLAAVKANYLCVSLLLRSGANAYIYNTRGYTALHYAAKSPGGDKVIRLLLCAGADPAWIGNDGYTALQVARQFQKSGARNRVLQDETVKMLEFSVLKPNFGLSKWRNGLCGPYLTRLVLTFLCGAQRNASEQGTQLPVLPVEMWDNILRCVDNIVWMINYWQHEDIQERKKREFAEKVSAARAAAEESMEMFDTLCEDDMQISRRRLPDILGLKASNSRPGFGSSGYLNQNTNPRFASEDDLGVSYEAPEPLLKAPRRGLPMGALMESDGEESNSEDDDNGNEMENDGADDDSIGLNDKQMDAARKRHRSDGYGTAQDTQYRVNIPCPDLLTALSTCNVEDTNNIASLWKEGSAVTHTDKGVYHDVFPLILNCSCEKRECFECQQLVSLCKLADHDVVCLERSMDCPLCSRPVPHKNLGKHFLKCKEYSIACNDCTIPLIRKEVESHRKNWHTHRPEAPNCPLRHVTCDRTPRLLCPARLHGCDFSTTSTTSLYKHITRCKSWETTCLNCTAVVKREDFSEHSKTCIAKKEIYTRVPIQTKEIMELQEQILQKSTS
eukprot:m.77342 g.77342  ORF g.77342 m.77342 type:complete len:633 (-) comp12618_c0_seq4:71-1969(-)